MADHLLTPAHFSMVASHLPGDPAVDDWGIPAAVIGRLAAVVSETEVYRGPRARAAALFHSAVRIPMLEHSNGKFAALVTLNYLAAHRIQSNAKSSDWAALAQRVDAGELSVHGVLNTFRDWTAASH